MAFFNNFLNIKKIFFFSLTKMVSSYHFPPKVENKKFNKKTVVVVTESECQPAASVRAVCAPGRRRADSAATLRSLFSRTEALKLLLVVVVGGSSPPALSL